MACVLCSMKKRLHDFQSDVQLIQESGGLSDLVSQKLEVLYQDTKNILDQTEDNTLDRSRLANSYRNRRRFLLIINQSLVRIGVEQVMRSGLQEAILDIAILNYSRDVIYCCNLGNWKYFFCRIPLTKRSLIGSKQVVRNAWVRTKVFPFNPISSTGFSCGV